MPVPEKRRRLRRILAGNACVYPASVHDPLSAHIADGMGFEAGMLGGSIASFVTLGAPDLAVLTLTEFAELARRITRYSQLSLVVDADHGYGNALHARRTVEELEAAGIAGMTLEDTVLPVPFAASRTDALVSIAEMRGKLRAAVAARSDPDLVILGRTRVGPEGLQDAIARLRAYEDTGVDALFVVNVTSLDQVDQIAAATGLPLVLNRTPGKATPADLAARRVKMALHGHQPTYAAARAIQEVYRHFLQGGTPDGLAGQIATESLMNAATHADEYARLRKDFLS
jgi:carboxyvinyl-carboxyphosphonate phosphorylmutase